MKIEQFYICIENCLSAMGFSLIAPLFPPLCKEKGISNQICSFIISIITIPEILVALYSPFIIQKFGRKKIFLIVLIFQALIIFVYGLMSSISNNLVFILVGLLSRLIHGFCNGIVNIICCSETALLNSGEELQLALGYLELSWFAGLLISPSLISALYAIGGYALPFYIVGFITLSGVYFYFKIPVKDDEEDEEVHRSIWDHSQNININEILKKKEVEHKKSQQVSIISMLNYPELLLSFLAIMINLNTINCVIPTLVNYLNERWGVSTSVASTYFIANSLTYAIAVQFINSIIRIFGIYLSASIGLILTGITCLFIAPLSFLPQSAWTVFFGICFQGFTSVFVNVPVFVELNTFCKNLFPKNENKATDIAGAILNISFYFGDCWEIVLASYINANYSFQKSCYFALTLNLIIAFLFIKYYYYRIIIKIKYLFNIKEDIVVDQKEEFLDNIG